MSTYRLNINIKQNSIKNINIKQNKLNINTNTAINILPVKDHNQLNNLDYEHSGHTGFASQKELENYVPKKLSLLPDVDSTSNRASILLYADDNGKSCKISIKDMLSKQIRTSSVIPDDLQEGEYVFLELKEEE